jgi:hypothetical protein
MGYDDMGLRVALGLALILATPAVVQSRGTRGVLSAPVRLGPRGFAPAGTQARWSSANAGIPEAKSPILATQ